MNWLILKSKEVLMKYLMLFLSILVITGCSFSGFQPPPPVDSWRFPGAEKYFALDNENGMFEYFDKQEKDMRACGIDPVIGDSLSAKSGLCMEKKGWYEKKGPVCEDPMFYNDPLCVKWRAKHKR